MTRNCYKRIRSQILCMRISPRTLHLI